MLPPVFRDQTAPREAPLLEVYPGTWLCTSARPCAPEVCWWLFLVTQPWVWPFCSLPQPSVTFHCLAPFDGFVVRAVLVLLTMWLTAFFSFPLVVLCDLWEEREEADFTLTFFKPTSFSKLFPLLCVPPCYCLQLLGHLCWIFFLLPTLNCCNCIGFSPWNFSICVHIRSQHLVFTDNFQICMCISNLSTEPPAHMPICLLKHSHLVIY